MSAGGARRGRRDNGLDAAEYAVAGDVDPRVGEHLLDVLAASGIAAYLQPASDLNPVTRTTTLPSRPMDWLYVDRDHLSTARGYLRRLAADERRASHNGLDIDAEWARIIAGFHTEVDPAQRSWPDAENVTDPADGAAEPDGPVERYLPTGADPSGHSGSDPADDTGADPADDAGADPADRPDPGPAAGTGTGDRDTGPTGGAGAGTDRRDTGPTGGAGAGTDPTRAPFGADGTQDRRTPVEPTADGTAGLFGAPPGTGRSGPGSRFGTGDGAGWLVDRRNRAPGQTPPGAVPAGSAAPGSASADEPSLLDALDTFGMGLPDDSDDEGYVPPPPPPLPQFSKYGIAAVIALIAGFVLFLFPHVGSIDPDVVMMFGFTCILSGFVTLVWRLRPGDDEEDDDDMDNGAVV